MRTDVAGCVGVEYALAFGDQTIGVGLFDDLRDGVADGFGEARRMHGDHVGFVDREDVVDRLNKVRLSAEHRGALGKRTAAGHDRLFVMPRERAAVIRTASLRTVRMRQAAMHPQGCVHRADRLAGFRRIDRQRLPFNDFAGRRVSKEGHFYLLNKGGLVSKCKYLHPLWSDFFMRPAHLPISCSSPADSSIGAWSARDLSPLLSHGGFRYDHTLALTIRATSA